MNVGFQVRITVHGTWRNGLDFAQTGLMVRKLKAVDRPNDGRVYPWGAVLKMKPTSSGFIITYVGK